MSANLILNISNEEITKPYKFKLTNINVYSFEEALYHCYHYWKQSVDDFLSEEFISWVSGTLKLSFLAAKIRMLAAIPSLSQRLVQFLSVTDYFNDEMLDRLRKEVILWENRNEWEKLKERGDYLINHDEPERAYFYYKKALEYGHNPQLLNNAAIALMKTEDYTDAAKYLEAALSSEPNDLNLSLHLAETYVLDAQYQKAVEVLHNIERHYGENSDVYYLYGEINIAENNPIKGITYLEKAISMTNHEEPVYIYSLSELYLKLRFYDKALDTLEKVKVKDKYFLKKQAEFYVQINNIPAAIKCIEKALLKDINSVDLWTKLAMYHRMDYDLVKANSAIFKALDIAPHNERALLEKARIRKSMGKIKDYQVILKGVLNSFKEKYRSSEE